jgi:WD40-like Beta Propeller Repeat
MRLRTAAALAAALSMVAAAPAAADSIAYIKDGNVWLATPDGSRQVQVTHTGGYSYVSQADSGVMIALAPGERLHKLSRAGEVLADFPTMVSDGLPSPGPVNRFHGPFEPTISPDGSLVAFEWFNDSYENDPSCSPSSVPPCYVYSSRQGVAITHSDRLTGPEEFGLLTGWIYPHWMSNDTLLRSWANTTMNDDAVINRVGAGKGDDELDHWFYDPLGSQTVSDVELSRDGKTVVGIVGQNEDKLHVYRPTVAPAGAPDWNHTPFAQGNQPVVEPCYEYGNPVGGKFQTVTIAPDGRSIAYSVGDGIWVSDVPDLGAGCGANATANQLRIPGGSYPDWGPADVPATVTPPHDPENARLTAKAARTRLGRALRRGLVVTVRGGGPGRATVKAVGGRKRVGKGSATASSAGTAKVKVRFTRRAKRALGRKRSVKLTLRVAFKPEAGATMRETAVVKLRR